jgi:hypothetical protein
MLSLCLLRPEAIFVRNHCDLPAAIVARIMKTLDLQMFSTLHYFRRPLPSKTEAPQVSF